jgi:hypothetical protein
MPLTPEHIHLAETIDHHVTRTLESGGAEALVLSLPDHIDTLKHLLETCSPEDIDALFERYQGLCQLALLLDKFA